MAAPRRITIIEGAERAADHAHAAHIDVSAGPLAVRCRTLAGGLADGVRLVELVAGTTRAFILPDRGLGIWKVNAAGTELGWQSPVRGPVHPMHVPLAEPSGLGWLDGFDELVARCGLVSNGAPDFSPEGRLRHGLHGRVANLPARSLEVILDEDQGTLTAEGIVDETRFLFHALRMTTTIRLSTAHSGIAWTDTVRNLSDRPATMQMLYHVNIGPPLLARGAAVEMAVAELAPRDGHAAADVPTWNTYDAPRPGRPEDVHYATLHAPGGRAAALLVAPGGRQAARLSWDTSTLPCFALWKQQGGEADGYVTGLEPATNFPNPRSFEESHGRVVRLEPHREVTFDLALDRLAGEEVAAARDAVRTAAALPARVHAAPRRGWSPGGVAGAILLAIVGMATGVAAEQTGPARGVIAADDSRRTLAEIGADGRVKWRRDNGPIHDLHLLPDGHLLLQDGWTRILELDRDRGVVWEYDAAGGDNAGRPVEVHAFQRLPDGATMIVESGPARILEVARDGTVLRRIPLTVDHPAVHSDTRNVRRTPAGTYLVAHERDGMVREYDGDGRVVWEYDVPLFGREPRGGHGPEAFGDQVYSAVRLADGNTLIGTGNGHSVLEVNPAGEIVWRLGQHDLPGIVLAWVTQVWRLPNGNTRFVNCHAGPDNPQIIEVDREKNVVWTFRDFDTFGDSMPVAVVLDR